MLPIDVSVRARAFPLGDAHHFRPNDVRNGQGLPAQGRSRLKKLVNMQKQDGLKKLVNLRLGTLNIGTLTGRSRELAGALKIRRIDIACVQETRWTGAKARDIGEGYKLMYNGGRLTQNGVGIIVGESLRNSIVQVERISDRLMSVKLDSGVSTLRVVSCYAPQTNCSVDEKDEFWENLERHLQTFGPEEHVVIGGDFNGHIGRDRTGLERVHGGEGFGIRNDDGNRLLDCAVAHELAIVNTFFRKRLAHQITYSSGGRASQIDYWLVGRQDLKLVLDVKVIPSENVAPQHRLLVLDMQFDVGQRKYIQKTGVERIKWWRLKEMKQKFLCGLESLAIDFDEPVESIWNELKKQIHVVAVNDLGKTKPGRRFIDKQTWWWNGEVQKAVKEKKLAYKKWVKSRTPTDHSEYRRLKLSAKQSVAKAKAAYYNCVYEELNTREGENKIYRLAAARHQSSQDIGHVRNIKDSNQEMIREPSAILQRWHDYFSEISNEEFAHPPICSATPLNEPIPNVTLAEVEIATKKMKNGKATGPDDIPSEVWKVWGGSGALILTKLFNKIIVEGRVPSDWSISTTIPIWKGKGDITECANYRPIRLLCHTMKIFERVLDARIREIVKIRPNQCGFVRGCGTTDAIHAARLLVEKHREKNRTVHMAFLDLEKAFDRVPHELIWHSLRSHDVPEGYIQWIKLLYCSASSVVRCPVGISPVFQIKVGVHQGSALSPLLFILCMDTMTHDLQLSPPWTLLYADDVMIADESRRGLEEQVQKWKTRLHENGMRLNTRKTEYMECGPETSGSIGLDGENLKKVTVFRYLGTALSSDGELTQEVRTRVSATWLKWRQVTGILCDHRMPVYLKSKIYRTMVRPVALYGSECWPTSSRHEQAIHVMEMKMLRWSLGKTKWDHVTNVEIRKRFGVAPITDKMRERRLGWYGHTVRGHVDSVANAALNLNLDGKRPRGRPKKIWLDRLKEDMKIANVTPEDTWDRIKWRRHCKSADPATMRE